MSRKDMKKSKKYVQEERESVVVCEAIEHDYKEYETLREEINNRHALSDSQSASAMVTVLAIWAAGFTLVGFAVNEDSCLNQMMLFMLQGVCMAIPPLYLLPVSMRSAENIRQILVIGTYIRLVFESKDSCLYNPDLNWETINYYTNDFLKSKRAWVGKLYYKEYPLLALLSTAFYIVLGFVSSKVVWLMPLNNGWKVFFYVLFALGFIATSAFSIIIFIETEKFLDYKGFEEDYVKGIIHYGIQRGIFDGNEEQLIKKSIVEKEKKEKGKKLYCLYGIGKAKEAAIFEKTWVHSAGRKRFVIFRSAVLIAPE